MPIRSRAPILLGSALAGALLASCNPTCGTTAPAFAHVAVAGAVATLDGSPVHGAIVLGEVFLPHLSAEVPAANGQWPTDSRGRYSIRVTGAGDGEGLLRVTVTPPEGSGLGARVAEDIPATLKWAQGQGWFCTRTVPPDTIHLDVALEPAPAG